MDWAWPSTIPGQRSVLFWYTRGLQFLWSRSSIRRLSWIGFETELCGSPHIVIVWSALHSPSLLLICIHGLHNPGLTRLAVLPIHGRPRSMFPGSFADSAFSPRGGASLVTHHTSTAALLSSASAIFFSYIFSRSNKSLVFFTCSRYSP